MIIDDAFDADRLIEFLQALIKDAGRKVFLILDHLRVHHSKLVKAWVSERQDQIELFLPAQLQPATQSARATQCLAETGDWQTRTGENQSQTT